MLDGKKITTHYCAICNKTGERDALEYAPKDWFYREEKYTGEGHSYDRYLILVCSMDCLMSEWKQQA